MNEITTKIQTGTVGELLVQIRLLQYDVQAAPPLKDSGNDLIAVKGTEFRAVSVRTTTNGRYRKPHPERLYDILAVVHLKGEERQIFLDESDIFLIPSPEVSGVSNRCEALADYRVSEDLVRGLFSRGADDRD